MDESGKAERRASANSHFGCTGWRFLGQLASQQWGCANDSTASWLERSWRFHLGEGRSQKPGNLRNSTWRAAQLCSAARRWFSNGRLRLRGNPAKDPSPRARSKRTNPDDLAGKGFAEQSLTLTGYRSETEASQ